MNTYKDCEYYNSLIWTDDICETPCPSDYCSKCPCFYKNQGGKTMEKLSRTILKINVRDNTVSYKDILPIIQRLAEYEESDLTPEEVKSLIQDNKALERNLGKREEDLLDCRETIVHLRDKLGSQQNSCNDTEVIEITPQDYIRLAVDNLFRAVEEMGEKK